MLLYFSCMTTTSFFIKYEQNEYFKHIFITKAIAKFPIKIYGILSNRHLENVKCFTIRKRNWKKSLKRIPTNSQSILKRFAK